MVGIRRRQFLVGAGSIGIGLSGAVGQVGATDVPENRIIWEQDSSSKTSPTVVDGTVYFGDWEKRVQAIDAATGDVRWRYKTSGDISTDLMVSNGEVYVGCDDGKMYALSTSNGRKQWSHKSREKIYPDPIVVSDYVYTLSSDGWLYKLDRENGERLTFFDVDDYNLGAIGPLVSTNKLFTITAFSTAKPGLFDLETGEFLWQNDDTSVEGLPTVTNGTAYYGGESVYALDASTGEVEWTYGSENESFNEPIIAGELIFVGSDDEYLYALDTGDGSEIWSLRVDGSIITPPIIVGETVYATTNEGYLYEVDAASGEQESVSDLVESGIVVDGVLFTTAPSAINLDTDGSSQGSRVLQGLRGHHHSYTGGPVPTDGFGTSVGTPSEPTQSPNTATPDRTPTTSNPTETATSSQSSGSGSGGTNSTQTRTATEPRANSTASPSPTESNCTVTTENESESMIGGVVPSPTIAQGLLAGFGTIGIGGTGYLLGRSRGDE